MSKSCTKVCLWGAFLLLPVTSAMCDDATPPLQKEDQKLDIGAILPRRSADIQALLKILNDPAADTSIDGSKRAAALTLGGLRAVEAVQALSDQIAFLPTVKSDTRFMSSDDSVPERWFPCARALTVIGEPSDVVRVVRQGVLRSKNSFEMALGCWVLIQLKGQKEALELFGRDGRPSGILNWSNPYDYIKNFHQTSGRVYGNMMGGSFKKVWDAAKQEDELKIKAATVPIPVPG